MDARWDGPWKINRAAGTIKLLYKELEFRKGGGGLGGKGLYLKQFAGKGGGY